MNQNEKSGEVYTIEDFWNFWYDDNKDFGQSYMEIRIKNKKVDNLKNFEMINRVSKEVNIPKTKSGVLVKNIKELKSVIHMCREVAQMWYGINPRKKLDDKYGMKGYSSKDGFVKGHFFIMIDIDKKDHNSAAKPKEIQEADNLADKLLADFGKNNWNQNYIKVCSGNGIQLLIKLDKPIIMPIIEQFEMDKDNRLLDVVVETDEFIKLKKALIFSFEDIFSKFKSDNYSIDLSSLQLGRVGSLPFTLNFKEHGITNRKLLKVVNNKKNEDITETILEKIKNFKINDNDFKKNDIIETVDWICLGIEQIACKKSLPSTGKYTKHDYLDGFVFSYCTANNKKELLKQYCSIQGRDMTAFTDIEKWQPMFSVLNSYLENNKKDNKNIKEWIKKCKKCPNLEKCKKLNVEKKKDKKTDRTSNIVILKNVYSIIVKKNFFENGIFSNSLELLDFDKIEKIHSEIINPFNSKDNIKIEYYEITIKEELYKIYHNEPGYETHLKNVILKAKKCRSIEWITTEVIDIVKKYIIDEDNFEIKSRKETTCHCFFNGKYLDTNHGYTNIQINFEKTNDGFKKDFQKFSSSNEYDKFIELKPDQNKIDKCVKIIKKLGRNIEEEIEIKKADAWANASILKAELKRYGINIFPNLMYIGPKGSTKTTTLKAFITNQWASQGNLSKSSLEGRPGARIRTLDNNCFPVYFDEIINFGFNTDAVKESATSGTFKIPMGTKDGGKRVIEKYFSIGASSNVFTFNDPAEADRFIISNYNWIGKKKTSISEFVYLNDNIIHIGKAKYLYLSKIELDKEIKKLLDKFDYIEDLRSKEKVVVIKIGEMISNKFGIFPDIELSVESILNQKSDRIIDDNKLVMNIIKSILNKFQLRDSNFNIYNLQKILNDSTIEYNDTTEIYNDDLKLNGKGKKKDDDSEKNKDKEEYQPIFLQTDNIIVEAEKYGLTFNVKGTVLYLTRGMLPLINAEIQKYKKGLFFGNLKQIAEALEINKDLYIRRTSMRSTLKNHVTKTGIVIGSCINEKPNFPNLDFINEKQDENDQKFEINKENDE